MVKNDNQNNMSYEYQTNRNELNTYRYKKSKMLWRDMNQSNKNKQ